MSALTIRKAGSDDAELVHKLLYELAVYEKLTDKFDLTIAMLQRDMLGANPLCHCALAFEGDAAIGILTWFFTYKSFRARRSLYLEDLFVRPEFRGRGHGKALLAWLAAEALAVDAASMEWQVLDWNEPSIAFYRGIGGKPVAEWITYRLDGAALAGLAKT